MSSFPLILLFHHKPEWKSGFYSHLTDLELRSPTPLLGSAMLGYGPSVAIGGDSTLMRRGPELSESTDTLEPNEPTRTTI